MNLEKDLRILLAEDNPADVLLIQEALNENGLNYSLRAFSDGGEAASFLKSIEKNTNPDCPDLALLDLNLPKVEGLELLQMIRQHPVCSHIPVIVVTSSNSSADRDKAAHMGASYYFRKPSSLPEFMLLGAVIKNLVFGKAASGPTD